MQLMVMDGQGGGIGATVIKGLRHSIGTDLEILALGTNSIATSRMRRPEPTGVLQEKMPLFVPARWWI